MAIDRKAMRDQLRKRAKESYDRREAFSNSIVSIFDQDLKMVGSLSEGVHFIDIIPFQAGRYWPTKMNFGGPGEWTPYMEIFVHYGVGASNGQYVCPMANYGKPCPICEQQAKLREKWSDPSEDQQNIIKNLYPKRRCVYNVIVCDDAKTEEKGIQVWDTSHWSIQRQIEALVVGRSGDPEIFYADPEEGKTLQFSRQGTGVTTQYVGFKFLDRDYQIDEETLGKTYVLDEHLNLPKDENGDILWKDYYNTIKDAFTSGEDEGDTEEEGIPVRSRKNPPMASGVVTPTDDSQSSSSEVDKPASQPSRTRRSQESESNDIIPPSRSRKQSEVDADVPFDEPEKAETIESTEKTVSEDSESNESSTRSRRSRSAVTEETKPSDAQPPVRSRRRMV